MVNPARYYPLVAFSPLVDYRTANKSKLNIFSYSSGLFHRIESTYRPSGSVSVSRSRKTKRRGPLKRLTMNYTT